MQKGSKYIWQLQEKEMSFCMKRELFFLHCTCWCDQQLKLVWYVPNSGVEYWTGKKLVIIWIIRIWLVTIWFDFVKNWLVWHVWMKMTHLRESLPLSLPDHWMLKIGNMIWLDIIMMRLPAHWMLQFWHHDMTWYNHYGPSRPLKAKNDMTSYNNDDENARPLKAADNINMILLDIIITTCREDECE